MVEMMLDMILVTQLRQKSLSRQREQPNTSNRPNTSNLDADVAKLRLKLTEIINECVTKLVAFRTRFHRQEISNW